MVNKSDQDLNHTQSQLQLVRDVRILGKHIQVLEENRDVSGDFRVTHDFLNRTYMP